MARKNEGKVALSKAMLMPEALRGLVEVLEFGEQKYSPAIEKGWLNYDIKETMDSLLRHAQAICNGELIDPESGLPHASSVLFNAAVILELDAKANACCSSEDLHEQMSLAGLNAS